MSESELKFVVNKRGYVRREVTKSHNLITCAMDTLEYTKKLTLVSKLKKFCDELKVMDDQVAKWMWEFNKDDADIQLEYEQCMLYNEKIAESLVLLEECVKQNGSSSGGSGTRAYPEKCHLRGITVPLPTFNCLEGENLEKFLKNFEATTDKYLYSAYDKFLLLKQQVKGRARILLDSLDIDSQTYECAKNLLVLALASPLMQKFNSIKQLSELKLNYDLDPFNYMSKVKNIMESFRTLDVKVDDVVQYFVWSGLNETFRTQLVHITGHTRPSLVEVMDNFFDASERYLGVVKNFKGRSTRPKEESGMRSENGGTRSKSVASLAIDVAEAGVSSKNDDFNAFYVCTLCNGTDKDAKHPIHKCPNFSDSKSKVDRLTLIGACTKCAKSNHKSNNCKFPFKNPCVRCRRMHFGFLCVHSEGDSLNLGENKFQNIPSESKKAPVKKKEKKANGVICVELKNSVCGGESVLPTFTGMLNGRLLRVLKDTGCQTSFISKLRAEKEDLKVLKTNIPLLINGFNSTKEFMTCLVEVPIVLDDTEYKVKAFCVPTIDTKLQLPGLDDICAKVTKKGFKFADEYLNNANDTIKDIDMILGVDYLYILSESNLVVGESPPSVFYETPFGIMLTGNLDTLSKNVEYLSDRSEALDDQNFKLLPDDVFSGIDDSVGEVVCDTVNISHIAQAFENTVENKFNVLDEQGNLILSELQKATNDILKSSCDALVNYDKTTYNDEFNENDRKLVDFVLNNTRREDDGRLTMPLLWNGKSSHLLGKNFNLSNQILSSNFKKYSKKQGCLKLIDESFREQEQMGIIERIADLPRFMEEHPSCSFLPHMSIFKLDRETTKCRNVFLSNLCEKGFLGRRAVSHNQAMFAGPCLNKKLTTSLLSLRFDEYLICFDLKKAFSQIALCKQDQDRLLFLWYRNVERGDFETIGYRNRRLTFGLRCSPTILMLALYKILILDAKTEKESSIELKKLMYDLVYMDNGAYTTGSKSQLNWAYDQFENIFSPYKFGVQQFVTNDQDLQDKVDCSLEEPTQDVVKLFGLAWDRQADELSTKPLFLDVEANTKRMILQSLATNFDPFNFSAPLLNRARLFMHELQCDKGLKWDDRLSEGRLREWKNIVRQVNVSPLITIKRFVGHRSQCYRLLAFTDASKVLFGTVIFIQCIETKETSFVTAKNRMVNKQLQGKSVPSLELQGIALGVETIMEIYQDLCGPGCLCPINIVELKLYTDSLVSLNWLNSYVLKLDKMNKKAVFVMNRLSSICKLCEICPVKFCFVSGYENPADYITRPISYKLLMRSTYFTGPSFLSTGGESEANSGELLEVIIPDPTAICTDRQDSRMDSKGVEAMVTVVIENDSKEFYEGLLVRYSRYSSLVGVMRSSLEFINKLKSRLKAKNPVKYEHWEVLDRKSCTAEALKYIFLNDQRIHFPEIHSYFSNASNDGVRDVPNLVGQLNVFPDRCGVFRVKSKFGRGRTDFPILLGKSSLLTGLIVRETHEKLSHSGCYSVLADLKKHYWIPHYYSVVKKVVRACVHCNRFNNKAVKLNQSPYREFRTDPPEVPFQSIFLDYFGPFWTKLSGKKVKVWVLCITCLWSRAINLKICIDMSVRSFLRAFQMHCFEFGMPARCMSDLGSQIVAGANVMRDFLHDADTIHYLQENGITNFEFTHYNKGCSELGSLVESCVKLTKRLLWGSVKNLVLDYWDFEFFVAQTVHLVNRRPIAFKEGLRDSDPTAPDPITPENLIKGYDLVSLNVVPYLQSDGGEDDWEPGNCDAKVKDTYASLRKVRERLRDIYHAEFYATLVAQATNVKSRYMPKKHEKLSPGDVILIKEPFLKASSYPMAIVKDVEENVLGEVVGVSAVKGKTKEVVRRHVSSVIPLLSDKGHVFKKESVGNTSSLETMQIYRKSKRKSAEESKQSTRKLIKAGLV